MAAVELSDLWKDVVSAVVGAGMGGLGTWIAATLHFGKKLEKQKTDLVATIEAAEKRSITAATQAKIEAVAELRRAIDDLNTDLRRFERDLEDLEKTNVNERIKSATDEANAEAWSRRLEEVSEQCSETAAVLNRIRGALQAKGFVVHE